METMEFPIALISLEGEPIRPLEVGTATEMQENSDEQKKSDIQELKDSETLELTESALESPLIGNSGKLIPSRLTKWTANTSKESC